MAEAASDVIFCTFDPARPGPYESYLLPHIPVQARLEPERFLGLGAAFGQYALAAAAVSFDRETPGQVLADSLFVDPEVRGQGIATQLLRLAAAVAAEAGAHTLKLSYILAGPELTAMDRVARKMGGDPAYVRPVYTMDSAQFRDSALLGRAFTAKYRPPESVVPFTDLTREQIEALYADPEVPWYVHPRNRTRMRPELSLAFLQEGRVAGFWLGSVSTPGNYSVQGVWRSPAAPVTTFHVLVAAHLNLCFYHGGGDFRYHCSPAVAFADELIQRYSEGKYRRLEEHAASIPLPYNE